MVHACLICEFLIFYFFAFNLISFWLRQIYVHYLLILLESIFYEYLCMCS